MKKHPFLFFVIGALVLPAAIMGAIKWYGKNAGALPMLGGEHHTISNFQLRSQLNKTTSLKEWNNKIVIANFFFTHCPVVCPKMMNSLKKIASAYAEKKDLVITSFTVDPERDSVAQLKKYADAMQLPGGWMLLTGDKKEIYALARKSLMVTVSQGDGGPADFIHSESLVLIDKQQKIRGYYNGTSAEEVNTLLADIKKLYNED